MQRVYAQLMFNAWVVESAIMARASLIATMLAVRAAAYVMPTLVDVRMRIVVSTVVTAVAVPYATKPRANAAAVEGSVNVRISFGHVMRVAVYRPCNAFFPKIVQVKCVTSRLANVWMHALVRKIVLVSKFAVRLKFVKRQGAQMQRRLTTVLPRASA